MAICTFVYVTTPVPQRQCLIGQPDHVSHAPDPRGTETLALFLGDSFPSNHWGN